MVNRTAGTGGEPLVVQDNGGQQGQLAEEERFYGGKSQTAEEDRYQRENLDSDHDEQRQKQLLQFGAC